MNTKPTESTAEFIDKFMSRLALGVFLMSISYGMDAIMELGLNGLPTYFETLQLVPTILAVSIIFFNFVKMVRLRGNSSKFGCEPESFVVDAYKKAAEKTFAYTFIFLIFLDFIESKFFNHLSPDFYIKLTLSITLLIFSTSFFLLNREGDIDDDDEFGGTS